VIGYGEKPINEIRGKMEDKGFRNLRIWQKSKELAVDIYKITNCGKFLKDFGLRDQIRRSAVSIANTNALRNVTQALYLFSRP
jgi:hypothetical protein